jgi:plasmid stabilization system protein ParE
MIFDLAIEAEAEKEFKEAVAWYDAKKPGVGQRLARDVRDLLRKVSENPNRYRLVGRRTRTARVPDWEYSVYFVVKEPAKVVVTAIFHAKRNPEDLRRRLE